MKESLESKILSRLWDAPDRVFSYGDFADLGSAGACRITLKRLCDAGKVERLFSGLYCLATEHTLSAGEIARALARKFNWMIRERSVPDLPSTSVCYFSSGPYRKYDIAGFHFEFQHTTSRRFVEERQRVRKRLHRLSQRVKSHLPARLINKIHQLVPEELRNSLKDDIEFLVAVNVALKDAIIGEGKKK